MCVPVWSCPLSVTILTEDCLMIHFGKQHRAITPTHLMYNQFNTDLSSRGLDHLGFPVFIQLCGCPFVYKSHNAWWTNSCQKAGSEHN